MIAVRRHTDVWLVRHAQTDWNQQRRYQSHADRPLTPFGHARTAAVAHRLRRQRFSIVATSGQHRTMALAEAVAQERAPAPLVVHDPRWREAAHGSWEGLTYPELARRYPREAQARFGDSWNSRAHGGESTADLWARVEAAWDDLLRAHDGGKLLIVTHATPIQLLLCALLRIPFERYWQLRIDLGAITNVDLYPSAPIIRTINEVPPLRERPT